MKSVGKHILIIPEGWCEYNYAQALKQSMPRDIVPPIFKTVKAFL